MPEDSLTPEMYLPDRNNYNHIEDGGRILFEDSFVWKPVDVCWYSSEQRELLARLSSQCDKIDELFKLSKSVGSLSDCCRAKMGCVVSYSDLSVRSTGYNHKPDGMPRSCTDAGCHPEHSCRVTIHAEVDAFKNIYIDEKEVTSGNVVVNYGAPCLDCLKLCTVRNVKAFIYLEARPQQEIDRAWLSAVSRLGDVMLLRYRHRP